MGEYENQHYIPRSYLRHFAFEGKVMLRRRGAVPHPAPVKSAAKAKHLYSLTLPDGTRDVTAEHTLDKFEGIAAQCLDALRRAGPVPRRGSDARHAIALFMALQRVRTPEDASEWLVPAAIAERAPSLPPTPDVVREYLLDVHLGVEPREEEVKHAHDWVCGVIAMGLPSKTERLSLMFDVAVREMAPRLEEMHWTLEECAEALFATCDRLPATWREPSDEDEYQGVGIEDAGELWLPLDPRHMLVLRRAGHEGVTRVDEARAWFVNRHLARHCYRAAFHDPRLVVGVDDMAMSGRPITLKFAGGPLMDDAGPTGREVIHLYTPIRDDAEQRC
jgi:hypothetical protein